MTFTVDGKKFKVDPAIDPVFLVANVRIGLGRDEEAKSPLSGWEPLDHHTDAARSSA
jgi:hypothetical protein